MPSTPFIELGYYVDARGYTVAWTPNHAVLGPLTMRGVEWAREIDMRRRPWYQAAVRGDRPILTPLYPSVQSGVPCFTVAAPVRRGGELAGVLGVDVNLGAWRKI